MPVCDYTAGLLAGVVSIFIGHPLDTIKTQQQLRSINCTEATKRIYHHRGWKGFYRGLSAPLLANGALNAVFFGIYGDLRNYLVERKNQETKQASYRDIFISGSIAGLVTITIAGPIELVKIKLQSQMKRTHFKGPLDCMKTILKDVGIRGFFRGLVPLMLRDGPGSGVYLVAYEGFKSLMEKQGYTSHSTGIVAGGIAGIVNWAVVLPFDTIKTRMQADDHVKPHYKSMMHVAREIQRTDGMVGLYRGFWSVSARAFPVNASIFLVYEIIESKFCKRV